MKFFVAGYILPSCFRFITALVLTGSTPEARSLASDSPSDSGFACGTMSLATLLRIEGRPTPPTLIGANLPARPEQSMSELRDVVRRFGLPLRGVRLQRKDWPLDLPALVHLNLQGGAGHYVVVRPVGSTGRIVQVIDPIHGVTTREADELLLSNQWTGVALIPLRFTDHVIVRIVPSIACILLSTAGFFFFRRSKSKSGVVSRVT